MKVIGQIIEYLNARGRLTGEDLAYLDAEGFCRNVEIYYGRTAPRDPEGDPDYTSADWYMDWGGEFEEAAAHQKERLKRHSRTQTSKGECKATDIRDWIVENRPGWEEALAPFLALARRLTPTATLETTPLLLRDADPNALVQAMAAELKTQPSHFEALWSALKFEEYRRCCEGGGEAEKAYRVVLTGRSLPEITKYAWILRYPEIAWVYTLIAAQRRLTHVCGMLFETQFPLIDTYLAHTYRSGALWPYIVLYSAHRFRQGTTTKLVGDERWLLSEAMPDLLQFDIAWEFALEMNRSEVLPFLVYATGSPETAGARARTSTRNGKLPYLCPSRWYKPY